MERRLPQLHIALHVSVLWSREREEYFSPFSAALSQLIRKYFLQLTQGCGKKDCDNPDCATGRGESLSPDEAASKALLLVQNKGRLCGSFSSPSKKSIPQSSSQLSVKSSISRSSSNHSASSTEQSVVSQETGVEGGHSEVTLLHTQPTPQPSSSEPMELAITPTDIHDHSRLHLVIGSSSSSVAQQFSQNRSSPSASLGSRANTTSSSSSSSSGPMLGSSSSCSSSSALVHMASSNMVDEVARMEVSPSPHPSTTPPLPPTAGKPSPEALPLQIGESTPTNTVI